MRSTVFLALGFAFILMGAGLFALTLRRGKGPPANPSKTQLREEAALAAEAGKMRLAAAVVAAFGLALCGLVLL